MAGKQGTRKSKRQHELDRAVRDAMDNPPGVANVKSSYPHIATQYAAMGQPDVAEDLSRQLMPHLHNRVRTFVTAKERQERKAKKEARDRAKKARGARS